MNKNQKPFSLKERIQSFRFAFNGLKIFFKEEHNSRIHITATFIVIVLGLYYKLSTIEWLVLLITIGFVIVIEIINTSIERLCNFLSTEKKEAIKIIKDLAAAAVLITSVIALLEGLFIFIPKIFTSCFH
ncbi:MAG: diacylglycerol kinase family protein [Arachidicoccus sp.]|nr:diacylglycerol kinase family protein [Arachidicoccus sp.]